MSIVGRSKPPLVGGFFVLQRNLPLNRIRSA